MNQHIRSIDNAPIPAHAEALRLFDFIARITRPSKFAPGATALDPHLLCPSCHTDAGTVPVDKTLICTGCGLHMHPDTTRLFIWRDAVPAEAAE